MRGPLTLEILNPEFVTHTLLAAPPIHTHRRTHLKPYKSTQLFVKLTLFAVSPNVLCCAPLEQCICKIRKVYLWDHAAVYLWGDTVMYLWGHTVVYLWGQTSVFVRADPSVFVTEEERSCYSRCSFRYFRLVYSHSQNSLPSTFTFPYSHIKILWQHNFNTSFWEAQYRLYFSGKRCCGAYLNI